MKAAGNPRSDAYIPVGTDQIVGGSKLLVQIRDLLRRKHDSLRTGQAYLEWARRYILFHGKRHSREMGEFQIAAFLNHLAVKRQVAASIQNQALNARGFLYKQLLTRGEIRRRHPHGTGTSWPQRRSHDHDLHSRHEQGADGCEESVVGDKVDLMDRGEH